MEYIQKVQKNHQRKEEQLNAIYGTDVLAAYLTSERTNQKLEGGDAHQITKSVEDEDEEACPIASIDPDALSY
ncbi:hypothetical protein SO802_030104 [Lithocarpus litseifolius]|uniref:Uncharacterized protein n=1 Tax=Lithocarpus litseifolius TaxID=425828 RepID=A0AAW2C0M0_9ROSI